MRSVPAPRVTLRARKKQPVAASAHLTPESSLKLVDPRRGVNPATAITRSPDKPGHGEDTKKRGTSDRRSTSPAQLALLREDRSADIFTQHARRESSGRIPQSQRIADALVDALVDAEMASGHFADKSGDSPTGANAFACR